MDSSIPFKGFGVFYYNISCVCSQLCGTEGGPNTYFPARVHSWRVGESGRIREGVEAIVSALNRKLHNICSLAYREGVNGQLCVLQCVLMLKKIAASRQTM